MTRADEVVGLRSFIIGCLGIAVGGWGGRRAGGWRLEVGGRCKKGSVFGDNDFIYVGQIIEVLIPLITLSFYFH
jgi:hypothetical protein